MITPILASASMGLASLEPIPVDLLVLARRPAAYAGRAVRTCGWASNVGEESSISDQPREPLRVLDVAWLPETPTMRPSVQRCVTGVIEPVCASPPTSKPGEVVYCIGSDWQLRQTTSSEK